MSGISLEEECENGELKGTSSISHIVYATENSFRPSQLIFQPLETGMTEDSLTA